MVALNRIYNSYRVVNVHNNKLTMIVLRANCICLMMSSVCKKVDELDRNRERISWSWKWESRKIPTIFITCIVVSFFFSSFFNVFNTLILLFFLNLIATYFDQFALINTSREEIRPSPPSPLPKKEKKI